MQGHDEHCAPDSDGSGARGTASTRDRAGQVDEVIRKLEGWQTGVMPALDAAFAFEGFVRQNAELDERSWARLAAAATGAMGRLLAASLGATDGDEDSRSKYAHISHRMHEDAAALVRACTGSRR